MTAGAGSVLLSTVPTIPANATYHILSYTGADPYSEITVGAPSRVLTLVDNTAQNSVDLTVNTAQPLYPIWTGLGNGSWDYASVNNWNLSTGGTANFELLDHPLFDDTPLSLGGTTSVTINNGNVNPLYVTFNNNNSAYTFSGTGGIIGLGSVTMTGAGAVTMSTSNNYSGGTFLNNGVVTTGNAAALGTGGVAVNGGTLQIGGTNLSVADLSGSAGMVANGGAAAATLTVGSDNSTQTYGGLIADGGPFPLSLTKTGTGNLVLTNPNTFSGTATISSGAVQMANPTALGTSTVNVGATNGLTFALGNTAPTIGGLSGGSNFALLDAGSYPVALTVGTNNGSATYSGAMTGAGSLIAAGGTTTLTSTSTFNGGVAVNGGVLSVNSLSLGGTNASALGEGPANASGQSIAFNAGTLVYTGGGVGSYGPAYNSQNFNPNITLNGSGGTIVLANVSGNGFVNFTGTLAGSGNLTFASTAANGAACPQFVLDTSTSNASTGFTGNVIIAAGGNVQYRTAATNPLGTAAAATLNTVTIQPGGLLSADNGTTGPSTLPNAIILNGGTLATQAPNMNYAGPVTVSPGALASIGWYSNGGGSPTLSGNLSGSGTVNTVGNGGEAVVLSGTTSVFTGTWQSTGIPTTFSGLANGSTAATFIANGQGFNINNGGVVNFGTLGGTAGIIQNGVASTSSTLSVGALGANMTYGGAMYNGAGQLTLATAGIGSLTLTGSAYNVAGIVNNSTIAFVSPSRQTVLAPISGAGALVKNGAGTLVLAGPSTYGGATSINAGTVMLFPNQVPAAGFGANTSGLASQNNGTWNFITNNASGYNTTFVSGGSLTLTDNQGNEGRTAWDLTNVYPTLGFTASFTYTEPAGAPSGADGIVFALQNAGSGAISGTAGGSMEYAGANNSTVGIAPSVGLMLNVYSNASGGVGDQFVTGGTYGANTSVSPVGLGTTSDPINVTVGYNASTQVFAWSMTDTVTGYSYSNSAAGVNLQKLLGGASAYLGFTGADGGSTSTQVISNFSYTQAAGANNVLPTGTALALNGILDLAGNSQTVGSLNGAGTVTNSIGGQVTFTAGGDNSAQLFTGMLSDGAGTLAVVKQGTGSWTLTGNNPYSGGTTISGGTLQVGDGGGGGTIGAGPVSMASNSVLAFNRNDAGLAISQAISGSGAVYQIGGGTTTLAANNGYNGGTFINNGAIQVGNGGATGSLSSGPIANNGALIFNRADSPIFANALSGAGAIYQVGGGSVALSGPAASFTGPITIASGNLYVNSANSTNGISVGSPANPSASFTLGGAGSAGSATATVLPGGNVEAGYNGYGSLTLYGLNFQNAGNVSINNVGQYSSVAAIDVTGSNQLSAQGGNSSITFYLGGTPPTNTTPEIYHLMQYSGSLEGNGLSGLSNVNLNTSNIVGLSSRALFTLLNDPGYIDLQYSVDYPIWTGAGNGIWTTSPPSQGPAYNWVLASNNSVPTDFLQNDAVLFNDTAGTNATVNIGAGNVSPASITFANTSSSYLITGNYGITSQNPIAVNFNGLGAVTIATSNNYFGVSTLSSGLLNIANSEALGSAAAGASLTINGGSIDNVTGSPLTTDDYPINWNGPFTFVGSNPLTLGSGSQGSVITLGNAAAVNVSGSTLTINDPIQDSGQGFTMTGAGVLQVLGSSTYTGPTIVNGGTLQVGSGGSGASINTTSGISLAANTALIFNDTDAVTMPSPITGAGGVVQSLGLINLAGTNGYTGGTTVTGGTLELSAGTGSSPAGTLAANSTVTVNAGATLQLNAQGALGSNGSATGLIVSSGTVYANPGYRIPLWNGATLAGATLASGIGNGDGNGNYSLAGQINATSDAGDNPTVINATQVSLAANTVLNVTRGPALASYDLIVNSVLSSYPAGNSLTIQGNGITQLAGANTYNGGTLVLGGTLQLANSSALGASTGGLTVAGGCLLDVNGYSPSVGALNGGGTIDTVGGGGGASPTLTIGIGGAGGTFSGTIQNTSGQLTLAKVGAGTQYLSGTNTYTGGTQLNGGVVNFTPGAVPLAGNSISFAGGTLQWAAGNMQDVSPYTAPIPATVSAAIDTNGNSVTFATGLSGAGGLTKTGAGTLNLTTPNTYAGTTNVTGGTLNVADANALAVSTVNVAVNNGLAFSVPSATLGGLSGTGNVTLSLPAPLGGGGVALSVGANNADTVYQGALGGGGGLTKVGTGATTLCGASTYTGATNISGGILRISAPVATSPVTAGLLYQLDPSNSSGYVLSAAGNVTQMTDLSGNGNSFFNAASAVALVNGGSAFNGNNVLYFNGASAASLVLNSPTSPETVFIVEQSGASGLENMFGDSRNDEDIRVNAGPLIENGSSANHNDFANGTGSLYVNGALQSGVALAGSPQLPEAYQGSSLAYPTPWAATALSNNAFGRYYNGYIGEVLVYSTSLSAAQRQAVEGYLMSKWLGTVSPSSGSNVLPATTPVTISNGGTFDMSNGTQTIASLSSTDGNGSQVLLGSTGLLTISGPASTVFDGAISGAGGAVVLQGGGLTLTGTSTYTGPTTVSGGTLQLGDGVARVGGLAGNIINNSTVVFDLPAGQTQQYSNVISGNGTLVKNGPGLTQLLNGQTYAGSTFVTAGTLQFTAGTRTTITNETTPITSFGANTSATGGSMSNGTWTFNTAGNYVTTPVTNNVFTLTDDSPNEARSAFYNTEIPTTHAFNISFVYQDYNTAGADGVVAMIQSDSRGVNALGGAGGSLGFEAGANNSPPMINNSVGVGMNINSNTNGGNGLDILANGSVLGETVNVNENFSTSPVNFSSRDPIAVDVSFNGSTEITASFQDLTTGSTFSYSYTAPVSLSTLVGNSAYFGFSGADGTTVSQQTISNLSFTETTATTTTVYGVNRLPTTTALSVAAGATLDLDGGTQQVASLSGSGLVTNSASKVLASLTVAGEPGTNTTFAGAIIDGSGTTALTLNGGELLLSGSNTYSGGTKIISGILQFADTGAMSSKGTVAVAGGAVLAVNAGGPGEFTNATSGTGSIGGLLAGTGGRGAPVTWADGAILGIDAIDATSGLTYGGNIVDGVNGPRGLAELGSGTLTLSGSNTYTGGTYVLDGATLIVSSPEAIDANGVGTELAVGSASLLADFGTGFSPVSPAGGSSAAASSPASALLVGSPVPEPCTLALAGALVAIAAACRRFRRRAEMELQNEK